jgi:hypothetical protein
MARGCTRRRSGSARPGRCHLVLGTKPTAPFRMSFLWAGGIPRRNLTSVLPSDAIELAVEASRKGPR